MIRLGVVGAADPRYRWFLAPAVRRRAGIRIVGLSEPEPGARADVTSLYDVAVWPDHHSLLEQADPTLVAVATPDSGRVTIDALRHGADVLVAPPVCQTLEELETITELVRSTGHRVIAAHTYRGHPAALTVRELGDKLGRLGLVCLSTPADGGSDHEGRLARSIMEALDVFSWLTGTPAVEDNIVIDTRPDASDDAAEIRQSLGELILTATRGGDDGPVLEVRHNAAVPDARELIQVVGDDGAVEWGTRDGTMRSAIGERPPLTLSCGTFVADEWVLTQLIRKSPPAISTEHSLAVTRLLLSAQESGLALAEPRSG